MNLNFSKVSYDGDLEDADEEQLRSLISDYEDAQEANAAEFEEAKDSIDDLEGVDTSEFSDAVDDLIEDITDYEAFEDAPLDESDLEAASFGKLREYDAYFSEQSSDEEVSEEEGPEFDDMGQKSPTHDEKDDSEFADKHLGGMSGVNY